jgi:hypothetical protein
MSQERPETEVQYCPGCEPDRDPSVGIVTSRPCFMHTPDLSGADDAGLRFSESFETNGNADADGATNRAWCAILHRKKE